MQTDKIGSGSMRRGQSRRLRAPAPKTPRVAAGICQKQGALANTSRSVLEYRDVYMEHEGQVGPFMVVVAGPSEPQPLGESLIRDSEVRVG